MLQFFPKESEMMPKRRNTEITVALWVGIGVCIYVILKSLPDIFTIFSSKNTLIANDYAEIIILLGYIFTLISLIALFKWKKWGAYLLFLTLLVWIGSFTLLYQLSVFYFLFVISIGFAIYVWLLYPLWKQLN